MSNNDYRVRVIDLPHSVNGIVALDEDGYANIYINAHLSLEGQRKALKHELAHLKNDDFHNNEDIHHVEQ